MTGRRTKQLALIALILLLTGLLVFLFYAPMRAVLAPLLASVYGRLSIYYRMVPQPVLWMVCIGLGIMAAVKSLLLNERWSLHRNTPPVSRGRVQTVRLWIRQAATEVFFDRRMAQHLGKLALEIQSHTSGHKAPPGSMRQRLENLDLPPRVRAYLQTGLEPMAASRPHPLDLPWLERLFGGQEIRPVPHIDLEETVRLLEDHR